MADYEFEQFDSKMHYLNRHNRADRYSPYGDTWRKFWLRPSCIPIIIILIFIVLVILLPRLPYAADSETLRTLPICNDSCIFTLVESIPEGLTYPSRNETNVPVFRSWMSLLNMANNDIDIASSYWSLRSKDVSNTTSYPSAWQGEKIFRRLEKLGISKKIKIRIAQSVPTPAQPDEDTWLLRKSGAAEVRSLNFTNFLGNGILHTKMWIVDRQHFYIGSANLDWRSLTQVKELGVVVYNCSCLAKDLSKIFDIYWYMGEPNASIPEHWPSKYDTDINMSAPLQVAFNQSASLTYLSSSPPELCSLGRTNDLDSIIDTVKSARKFVYIAVMDYVPATLYTRSVQFWPVIDDALREAAIARSLEIRLLISWWKHSPREMLGYLYSLEALSDIPGVSVRVKLFVVPPYKQKIPYTRVNHNKYMVTDSTLYVGTSNWSADYFLWTGGVGFILSAPSNGTDSRGHPARQKVESVFIRDWTSPYAHTLDDVLM